MFWHRRTGCWHGGGRPPKVAWCWSAVLALHSGCMLPEVTASSGLEPANQPGANWHAGNPSAETAASDNSADSTSVSTRFTSATPSTAIPQQAPAPSTTTRLDACTPNPCQAGGICLLVPSGYECMCSDARTGIDCEFEEACSIGHSGCAEVCNSVAGRAVCSCRDRGQLGADGKSCMHWGEPVQVDDGTRPFIADSSIATGADGSALVAWCQTSGGSSQLFVRMYSPSEGWKAPAVLAAQPGGCAWSALHPVVRSDGLALLLHDQWEETEERSETFARHFERGTWNAPIQSPGAPDSATSTTAPAYNRAGDVLWVFLQYNDSNRDTIGWVSR